MPARPLQRAAPVPTARGGIRPRTTPSRQLEFDTENASGLFERLKVPWQAQVQYQSHHSANGPAASPVAAMTAIKARPKPITRGAPEHIPLLAKRCWPLLSKQVYPHLTRGLVSLSIIGLDALALVCASR